MINGPGPSSRMKPLALTMAWRPADPAGRQADELLPRRQRLCSIDPSKDKALAQQFIEFINQPQYVKARYVATGEIPPLKAMIDDPVIKNDQASAVAIQSARAVAMPGIPEMGKWGRPTPRLN